MLQYKNKCNYCHTNIRMMNDMNYTRNTHLACCGKFEEILSLVLFLFACLFVMVATLETPKFYQGLYYKQFNLFKLNSFISRVETEKIHFLFHAVIICYLDTIL